jgi:hypothetical protein
MRCARCQRNLLRPAAEVKTRAGVDTYGQVCAERMGLLKPKRRPRPTPQLDLFGATA